MRLIDADALIKDFGYLYTKNHIPVDMRARETLSTVMEQPTAYDVDKVVKQLEELEGRYNSVDFGIKGIICKAIEIVKAGGEDAKTDS